MDRQAVSDINTLGRFLGQRDVNALTTEELVRVIGQPQADVMVLFGGSIAAGAEVFYDAFRNHVAKKYVIVGGEGHTTPALREFIHTLCPDIETEKEPEAVVFNRYLKNRYNVEADFLETHSTNCGNNITLLLELMKENGIKCDSIILCQDATMQKRMEAGLRKYAPLMRIVNFAAYRATLKEDMAFEESILGMWDAERYITLLMGEIPRLTDDENGYGPKGKDYIAHVEIPGEVAEAFRRLERDYGAMIRRANEAFKDIRR